MVKQLFSIHDVKAKYFFAPVSLNSEGEARRLLSDAVSDTQTVINRHPEDFRLYRLGEFDDNSGVLSPLAQPEFVCDAVEYIVKSGN